MIITFGKTHKGESIYKVSISDPLYIKWVLDQQDPHEPLASAKKEIERVISTIDEKPYQNKCLGCGSRAKYFTGYIGSDIFYFWCGSCDPYSNGAIKGKLIVIDGYRKALSFVRDYCGNTKEGYKQIIKEMAVAKGLKTPMTSANIKRFFGVPG